MVIDASSINVVDITAIQKVDELREELAARGITLVSARVKLNLSKYFNEEWGARRKETYAKYRYDTLKSAVRAFDNRDMKADGPDSNQGAVIFKQAANAAPLDDGREYP